MNSGEQSLIDFVADETKTRQIRLLVIGGWALQAYGFARQTVDLDCLIADADSLAVDALLCDGGFQELAKTDNFRRYRHPNFGYVDVLLVSAETFEKMYADAQTFLTASIDLKVPSLPHLIALKLHAIKNAPERELRELADIVQVARLNRLAGGELQELCAQFGPPNIWRKLSGQLYGNH